MPHTQITIGPHLGRTTITADLDYGPDLAGPSAIRVQFDSNLVLTLSFGVAKDLADSLIEALDVIGAMK